MQEAVEKENIRIRLGGRVYALGFKPVKAYVHSSFINKRSIGSIDNSWCWADAEEKRLKEVYADIADCFHENLSADGDNVHVMPSIDEKGNPIEEIETRPSVAIYADFYPLRVRLCRELAELSESKAKITTLEQILSVSKSNAELQEKLKEFDLSALEKITEGYAVLESLIQPKDSANAHTANGLQQFRKDVSYVVGEIQRLTKENPSAQPQR